MIDPQPFKDANDAHRNGVNLSEMARNAWAEQPECEPPVAPWPVLQGPAFRGLAGEIANAATENSEADPVAVIATALTFAGATFGRNRHFDVGDTPHHGRLFTALVGASSRARKGTSLDPVRKIFDSAADHLRQASTLPFPSGSPLKIVYGLSSGEGLINAIRDKCGDDDEGGVTDKRMLCIEGEFASVLKMGQRQGNTIGTVLRLAWDGWKLEPLTKNDTIAATEPHISLLGHITRHELQSLLNTTDTHNGFVNRFCWFAVRRQKACPFPKPMPEETVSEFGKQLAEIIAWNHGHAGAGRKLVMSNTAMNHYADVYPELTTDHPGLLGAATSRAEAQTLRLAIIYAQLDRADRIEIVHLEAALALWRYAFDSAAHIFGDAEIDPAAQRIIEFLSNGPRTQGDIVDLFGRNKKGPEIKGLLEGLQERGRITLRKMSPPSGKGRPPTLWSLTGV
mgnify:CR=1 FL=1